MDDTDAALQRLRDYIIGTGKRIAELETALQIAFNHAGDWTTTEMQDHCWEALEK